jgi:hypothetical protein
MARRRDGDPFEMRAKGLLPADEPPYAPEKPKFGKDQTKFLEAMRRCYNVEMARLDCGFSAETVKAMGAEDPEFFRAVMEETKGPLSQVMAKILDAALNGVEEPVVYKGLPTGGTVRRHKPEYLKLAATIFFPSKFAKDERVLVFAPEDRGGLGDDDEEIIRITDALL